MALIWDKSQIEALNDEDGKEDLDLKDLDHFSGTTAYYKYFGVCLTDGVKYIMQNGYSWFVSDSVIEILYSRKLRAQPFLAIKLIVNREKKTAVVRFEDGNNHILKRRVYEYTDARRDLTLFFVDNVLMLAGEY